jgi:hypothetical protein
MTRNSTNALKAKLRDRFPTCKFSITRGGEHIEWTDDGPTVVEVEDAIITTGLVEIRHAGNERYLRLRAGSRSSSYSIWLQRYNVAERAAELQETERRRTEQEEEQKSTEAATREAQQTKRKAIQALQDPSTELDNSCLQEAYEAFNQLRQRAEAAIAVEQERDRRPSWAPPLVLGSELLELCKALGYLPADAAPIARLWASYADPKRSRTVLRETKSTLPLAGIDCRGFQLFAGAERGNTSELLFEAQLDNDGTWRFGPTFHSTYFFPSYEWTRLTRERAAAEYRLAKYGTNGWGHLPAEIAKINQRLAEIDEHDLAAATKRRKYSEQRTRALQLAQHRVLEFVGAPDAQMQAAARLCGHCCICFKVLTDPISLERGIGPDCYARRVDFIRANAASESVESLAFMTGMPCNFVTEVINENARAS